ncbi:MAG: lactonase family protein [Planctomycetota bacterium]
MIHSRRFILANDKLLFTMFAIVATVAARAEMVDAWIGTGGKESRGIYHVALDTESGKITKPQVAAEISSPGFLALHPSGRYLYAGARRDGKGIVASYRIKSGTGQPRLVPMNEQPLESGSSTCVAVDQTGSVLLSVQYGAGTVATFPLGDDGTIGSRNQTIAHAETGTGIVKGRQDRPHPHWIGTGPNNRFVFVPDLGLDSIQIYELFPDAATIKDHGKAKLAKGAGPRHMKFDPTGKYAYVLNELSLTITAFSFDAESGTLTEIQTIPTLKDEDKEVDLNTASEIRIHPTGRYVYAGNRGHDSIAVFQVDSSSGKLSHVETESVRGSWPRNFNIDPSGRWVLVGGQHSNTVSVFLVDQNNGGLIFTRQVENMPQPICFVFTRRG